VSATAQLRAPEEPEALRDEHKSSFALEKTRTRSGDIR
jgi:hypothetical protein